MEKELSVREWKAIQWAQLILYSGLILYLGRSILVPLSFSLLISFVLFPVCSWLERKGINRITAIILSLSILLVIALLLLALLVHQFIGFVNEWPTLREKLAETWVSMADFLTSAGFSRERQDAIMSSLSAESGSSLIGFVRSTLSASVYSAIMIVLIPVYCILILYYRAYWMMILCRLFPGETKEELHHVVYLTIQAYYNFIKGMAIVYVMVGILNSAGLLLIGVPHAILFGFIASILTFIPYVGIIIGSLLPIAISWITFDSVWYPLGVVAVFTFVQYLEANVIFPFAVSNRLNVNTLVMLLAIFTGGLVWGVSGMILFVPFAGIAKLIADHQPRWKTISLVLGTDRREAPRRKRRRRAKSDAG